VLKKILYKNIYENLSINLVAINARFNHVCVFDSNEELNKNDNLDSSKIVAVGAVKTLVVAAGLNSLDKLQSFIDESNGWVFGYLSYDLKNEIENLSSSNIDELNFPLITFFVPELVLKIKKGTTNLYFDDDLMTIDKANEIYQYCIKENDLNVNEESTQVKIKSRISKSAYIDSVNKLKNHIKKGDIYEINFCQEFYAKGEIINAVNVFEKLNRISKAPFSAFCKFDSKYVLCASPERFIKKNGNKLISQPIKGTSKRLEDKFLDDEIKRSLLNNEKEKSENIMIVDLVRNDLSKIAIKGSVKVEELMGVYSFKQVHQLISTVSCEIKKEVSFTDVLKSLFPMGSMTGAPKVSAMKLIEQNEASLRGVYSGALGYISPEGDFDFNVVIRSILYNEENKYVSFTVGSAITDKSIAENEYDECLLKAKAMFEVLLKQKP
jgi:para-aminobenzoate synthetase component 1